jgi:hypothetical protein
LVLDVSQLQSNVLNITANVTALGQDINPANNIVRNALFFKEKATLKVVE